MLIRNIVILPNAAPGGPLRVDNTNLIIIVVLLQLLSLLLLLLLLIIILLLLLLLIIITVIMPNVASGGPLRVARPDGGGPVREQDRGAVYQKRYIHI